MQYLCDIEGMRVSLGSFVSVWFVHIQRYMYLQLLKRCKVGWMELGVESH